MASKEVEQLEIYRNASEMLGFLAVAAGEISFSDHSPRVQKYWKALDLADMAIFLAGFKLWSRTSKTGGISMTPARAMAERYMMVRLPRSCRKDSYVDLSNFDNPSTRLLVSISDSVTVAPAHHYPRDTGEVIATEMQFSDIDPQSQNFIRGVFHLPKDYDAYLIVD